MNNDDHLLIKGVQKEEDKFAQIEQLLLHVVHTVGNIIQHIGRLEDRLKLIEEMMKRDDALDE